MSVRTRFASVSALGCSAAILFVACGDDTSTEDGGGSDVAEVAFEQEVELFPGFSHDTGLQPAGSPVQASFAVSALGTGTVTAVGAASGSDDAPTLTGLPEQGEVTLGGGFALLGNLVVDIDGLPSYDGPIPGIENVEIPFEGAATFDPFVIDGAAAASAPVEPARLPGIPLPGGIPGQLVLEVAEGSSVDVTLSGRAVCADDGEALYTAGLARGGVLVIRPVVEIEVPLVGTQSFEIPELSVDLALGTIDLAMTGEVERYGARPSEGDHVDADCSTGGAGGGGTGATATSSTGDAATSTAATGLGPGSGSTGSGTTACEEHADCSPYPCVEGTCSPGGGLCDTGYTYEDEYVDECVTSYCCDALEACTYDHEDVAGCNDCIAAGGGARCNAYLDCLQGSCLGYTFCDYYAAPTQEQADCYGAYCCDAFEQCTGYGSNNEGCETCLANGGGPECDVVFTCIADNGCPALF